MILLIRHITTYLAITSKWFKFHYDSINSSEGIKEYTCKTWFKFHYDSINSAVWIDCNEIISIYLNSIMILLIHFHDGCWLCRGFHHLNSIMILLIPVRGWGVKIRLLKFKFHYDSINSFLLPVLSDLNSIMILLIRIAFVCAYGDIFI